MTIVTTNYWHHATLLPCLFNILFNLILVAVGFHFLPIFSFIIWMSDFLITLEFCFPGLFLWSFIIFLSKPIYISSCFNGNLVWFQCQSQLKTLYAEGIEGCHMEFSAYHLLCVILHSNNYRDLLSSMSRSVMTGERPLYFYLCLPIIFLSLMCCVSQYSV